MAENDMEALAVEAMAKAHCDFFGGEGWWDTGLIADTKPKAMDAMRAALTALRSTTAEPNPAPAVAIPRLPKGTSLYGGPDYLDDPDGLARWRDAATSMPGHDMAPVNINSLRRLLDTIERLRVAHPTDSAAKDAEIAAYREALTPSGDTKAAYHGEFTFDTEDGVSDAGIEQWRKVYVPWTTVKEIMKAISNRAALANRGEAGALAKERGE